MKILEVIDKLQDTFKIYGNMDVTKIDITDDNVIINNNGIELEDLLDGDLPDTEEEIESYYPYTLK